MMPASVFASMANQSEPLRQHPGPPCLGVNGDQFIFRAGSDETSLSAIPIATEEKELINHIII